MNKKKLETNSRVAKLNRKEEICKEHRLCSWCPIHGGENARNVRKHGRQKPKYKNKRR